MLIKCPECGHDNQLGAIFCRNCGKKLNIEEIAPTVKDKGSGINIFGLIRKLIGLVILLALIALIAGLFVQSGLKTFPDLDDETKTAANEKGDKLIKALNGEGRQTRFEFTGPEAGFILNEKFLAKASDDSGQSYLIDDVNFDISADKQVTIVLNTRLGGKIPVRFEVTGNIVANEAAGEVAEGQPVPLPIKFEITEAKMGHVPFPGSPAILRQKIIEKYIPLTEGTEKDNIGKLRKFLKNIQIGDESQLIVTLVD